MAHAFKQRIYEFDDFRIDVDHRMLYHQGSEIPLVPKAVETLLALIERRGKIISKDELLEAVWPETVVEESNLFVYLSVLRKTLGTLEDGRPYVETLRRRGYRFNGEVHLVEEAVDDKNYELAVNEFEQSRTNVQSQAVRLHVVKKLIEPIDSFRSTTTDSLSVNDLPTDLSVWRQTNPAVNEIPESRRDWSLRRSSFAAIGVIGLVAALAFSYTYFFRRSTNPRSINSIAVMPFVNESRDAELEDLADGMTETLITSLRKVPDLGVQARTTVFRYIRQGKDPDARTIGTELNVQAVLYGWIVRRGDDFTLKVELVDAKTGNRLWEESYNRKMSNLIEIQSDAARDLVSNLRIKLSGSTEQKLAKNYTENVEAYTLFVKGQSFVRKLTRQDIRTGIGYLERAKDIDPSYALAYVGLAEAYRALALAGEMPPGEVLPKAKEAALKAVQIDDTLAEAHSSLGATLCYDWNWPEAEKHLLRGLELDPNSSLAHFAYAHFLNSMRGPEEARGEFDRAQKLEPFDAYINAPAANRSEHPEEAMNRIKSTIDLDPKFYFAHVLAAGIYRRNGLYAESLAESRLAKTLAPDQTWSDVGLISTLVRMGKTGEARSILDEILRLSQTRYVPAYNIALAYNELGATDKAFVFLEESYKTRGTRLTLLKSEPRWNNLRNDPRFQDLMRRVGLVGPK